MTKSSLIKQGGFVVILAGVPILLFFLLTAYRDWKAPGFYGSTTTNEQGETVHHKIPDFTFTNQQGQSVTEDDLNGQITIVNFFFTSCPTICPKMMNKLKRVQNKFAENDKVQILSHTVDPEHDSVDVLADYGQRLSIKPGMWDLVTGDKRKIYKMARSGYELVAVEGKKGDGSGFVHSERVALIDWERRIRGYYEGTEDEDIDKLMEDVRFLLKKYQNRPDI